MKTCKEFAMDSWAKNCNMQVKTTLERLRCSEWSPRFYQLMRNRLIMGRFRYESFEAKRSSFGYDQVSSMHKRLDAYEKTGNDEHLVDIANLCLLEFEFGKHPNKHFKSVDDGEHTEKFKGK